ncbi:hypothetical protein G6F22_018772 [Rhizopus arrhizus]|nr:hypothetical protein G6F22_018772 [Rhizopus arrhizus]
MPRAASATSTLRAPSPPVATTPAARDVVINCAAKLPRRSATVSESSPSSCPSGASSSTVPASAGACAWCCSSGWLQACHAASSASWASDGVQVSAPEACRAAACARAALCCEVTTTTTGAV